MKVIRSGRPAAAGEVGLRKKVRETGEFAGVSGSSWLHPELLGSRPTDESAENKEKRKEFQGVCAPGAGRPAARVIHRLSTRNL
tara:strand:- start:158 stop:409 length:252 start_codon:yes stop_codon:yes gene_type:complete